MKRSKAIVYTVVLRFVFVVSNYVFIYDHTEIWQNQWYTVLMQSIRTL